MGRRVSLASISVSISSGRSRRMLSLLLAILLVSSAAASLAQTQTDRAAQNREPSAFIDVGQRNRLRHSYWREISPRQLSVSGEERKSVAA
jgi:Ni/Co efflux regulator RcnB